MASNVSCARARGVQTLAFLVVICAALVADSDAAYARRGVARASWANPSFHIEMDFADVGPKRALHVNDIPAEKFEAVVRSIARDVFRVKMPAVHHSVTPIPHPTMPNDFEPRRIRSATWVDPFGRTWNVTSETMRAGGVFDGFEVSFPSMTDVSEAETAASALWAAGFLGRGELSSTHVHVDGACLLDADVGGADALGLANLLVMYEKNDALIRRIFGTKHYGGSRNPHARPLAEAHSGLVEQIGALAAQAVARKGALPLESILSVFDHYLAAELDILQLSPSVLEDAPRSNLSPEMRAALSAIWKRHSLDITGLVPINPSTFVEHGANATVSFRAFDLLHPTALRLAVKLCRAMVKKACADAASLKVMPSVGSLPMAPMGGETAVDLLPEDPKVVRDMAIRLLRDLGLDVMEFAPVLTTIRHESSDNWAEDPAVVENAAPARDRMVETRAKRSAMGETNAPMFGLEMEFAGVGSMSVLHVNDMPESNFEKVMQVIAHAVTDAPRGELRHAIAEVPHPRFPKRYEPRRLRSVTWIDPKERTWLVESQYVSAGGIYDGYEVIFPRMSDAGEAEQVVSALWSSGLLKAGEKSATRVDVDGTCLVNGRPGDRSASALGAANLIILHEKNEALIRRLFQTRHFGGSRNRFARALGDIHGRLVERISGAAGKAAGSASVLTVGDLADIFAKYADAELQFLGLDAFASSDNSTAAAIRRKLGRERANAEQNLWKFHSLNVADLLPINPTVSESVLGSVSFRAFDLLQGPTARLAIKFCRALVQASCSAASQNVAFSLGGRMRQAPVNGESAVDLLPANPKVVRGMALSLLEELGLDRVEFAPLLDLIREEKASEWAVQPVAISALGLARDRLVSKARRSAKATVVDGRAFGVEMEFAGLGPMRVAHINDMPQENYEAVLKAIAERVFNVKRAAIKHVVTPVPHPRFPDKFEPRKVRTSTWTDPKGRSWKVTSEYVSANGVYDGYEVVFPPMLDPAEAEAAAQALWGTGTLGRGAKSATHVHVNGTCLVDGDPSDLRSGALGLANLLVLHEKNEALIRRLFETRHFGGSRNRFSRSLGSVHHELIPRIAALAARAAAGRGVISIATLKQAFNRHLDDELAALGMDRSILRDDARLGRSLDEAMERFNSRKKIWKYHSLNIANLIPINPAVFTGRKSTAEFRAFDLLSPEALRLAVKFCQALVNRACAQAAHHTAISLGSSVNAELPLGGEVAVDMLPADPREVRAMATHLLQTLGLNVTEFEPLLERIRAETTDGWAEVLDEPHEIVADRRIDSKRSARKDRSADMEDARVADLAQAAVEERAGGHDEEVRAEVVLRREQWDTLRMESDGSDEVTAEDMALAMADDEDDMVDDNEWDGYDDSGADDAVRMMAADECATNPCKNGGTCIPEDKGFFCLCPDHYFGDLCEKSNLHSTPLPSTVHPTHVPSTSHERASSVTSSPASARTSVSPTETRKPLPTSSVSSSHTVQPQTSTEEPQSTTPVEPSPTSSAPATPSPSPPGPDPLAPWRAALHAWRLAFASWKKVLGRGCTAFFSQLVR